MWTCGIAIGDAAGEAGDAQQRLQRIGRQASDPGAAIAVALDPM